MDPTRPNRFPNRKPTPSERFLGVPSRALPSSPSTASTAEELHEDDVVFLTNDSSSSSPSITEPHHKAFPFAPPDSFGILAALPENETSPNLRSVSQLFHNHKASISSSSSTASSSSSSSRLIPRPPSQERISSATTTSSSSAKFHPQSAPVNVPVLSEAMMKARRRQREFDDIDDVEDEEEEEMLPPHEIVARNSAQTPMLACSVLEGVGRTLKGRDLRRVRNAVWRQIGFLD
ncbi:hypothetical protein RIF29_31699 [Crotalaria pallida]|uniref:Senescence regulator S40 n=1 Tax=Crotalaria pallida TaxID=3830 RepID=A0AAN9EPL2_CROPI